MSREAKTAAVSLNPRQLGQLRRRMRHIAGLLEQGATSENASTYYRAELSALRQVVDAFAPNGARVCGTGEEAWCQGASERVMAIVHARDCEARLCTADAAEEDGT